MKKIILITTMLFSLSSQASSLISTVPSLAYKCEKSSIHCEEALQAINELKNSLNDSVLFEKLENLEDAIRSNIEIKEAANSFLKESLKVKK